MNGGPAEGLAAEAPEGDGAGPEQQCVLLACFAGAKRAEKIHRELNKRIAQGGDAILDQVVVKVNAKHKAQVHDPRRTLAGTLTPVLTWGLFGLLAGGLKSLAVWAVVGGICGGLYAYYFEHLATKDELKRIGRRLPADSSALFAFVRGADPRRILSSAASLQPTTASVAAIAADLSAQVYSGATEPVESSATPAGAAAAGAAAQDAVLDMLMVRFAGEHAARQALAESGSKKHEDQKEPEVELFIEANEHGRRRVVAPKTGTAAFAKSDILGWGVFGVAVRVDRGLRRRERRRPRRHRERAAHRRSLGHLRRFRRCPVRHVGGPRGVRPAAEGARRLRAARLLPGARLGGGLRSARKRSSAGPRPGRSG